MRAQIQPVQPWYRVPVTWLLVALPASAVVASTLTAVVAIRNPDPVIKAEGGDRPAIEARNHAATGGKKGSAGGR